MEEVRGTVEKINPKGVKIDGRWYNYSKYMEEDAPKLNEGDEIRVDVNGDWIMRFKSPSHQPSDTGEERVNGSTTRQGSGTSQRRVEEGNYYTEPASAGWKETKSFERQVIVTRLACLNTATEILKSHTKPITSQSLFKVAKELEGWVWRGVTEEENGPDHDSEEKSTQTFKFQKSTGRED
jgi:hypothetical protein